jgi:hypothetical protein
MIACADAKRVLTAAERKEEGIGQPMNINGEMDTQEQAVAKAGAEAF